MNKWTTWGLFLTALILPVVAFGKKSTPSDYHYSDEFINAVKSAVGSLTSIQVSSIKLIVNYFYAAGYADIAQLSYILATAWHECSLVAKKEIRCNVTQACYQAQEAYWYTGYFGRGYVQLTWKSTYEKMGNLLDIDLVNNPDQALHPPLAAQIIVEGMMRGSFTGKSLPEYINDFEVDFYNARRTVNGTQNAAVIKSTAMKILTALPT